jgi:hypothetical protein
LTDLTRLIQSLTLMTVIKNLGRHTKSNSRRHFAKPNCCLPYVYNDLHFIHIAPSPTVQQQMHLLFFGLSAPISSVPRCLRHFLRAGATASSSPPSPSVSDDDIHQGWSVHPRVNGPKRCHQPPHRAVPCQCHQPPRRRCPLHFRHPFPSLHLPPTLPPPLIPPVAAATRPTRRQRSWGRGRPGGVPWWVPLLSPNRPLRAPN